MKLSIIVAVDKNWGIGKDNQLLWHLPADLKHFKELTMGHVIIMGRKTFQSIGKALPGRTSVIITRDKSFTAEGCTVVYSLEEALNFAKSHENAFIIGGGEIYKQSIALADALFLTKVYVECEVDTCFPTIDEKEWSEISSEFFNADEKNKFDYSFLEYSRK